MTTSDFLKPLPSAKRSMEIQQALPAEVVERAKKGFFPEDMSGRWAAEFSDPWLSIYRSWSGICIYRLRIEKCDCSPGHEFKITTLEINNDANEYCPEADDLEKKRAIALIRSLFG